MAALANPQLMALMQAMQARGGAPNPQAQMAAAMPPLGAGAQGGTGMGPLPGGTGMGGLPPGWQAALNNIGQAGPPNAQAAMTAAMPQLGPGANAMVPQGTLSPQAIQAAGGILAGRRPRLSR